jgi:hypothetical protein
MPSVEMDANSDRVWDSNPHIRRSTIAPDGNPPVVARRQDVQQVNPVAGGRRQRPLDILCQDGRRGARTIGGRRRAFLNQAP